MWVDAQGRHHYGTSGTIYTPVPDAERKYGRRKPDPFPEGCFRFRGEWLMPLPLIPDDEREMPETVADDEGRTHELGCPCELCQRPETKRQKRFEHGVYPRPGSPFHV